MDTFEECHSVLTKFIASHEGMKQRDEQWKAKLGRTVGGSELAAITGKNKYSTFYDIVANKINIVNQKYSDISGLACLWGTLFEDVAAKYVGFLYECEPIGTEICIMSRPGFRYSPDGYIVGSVKADGTLWKKGEDKSLIKYYQPTLIEIKCPLRRSPKDIIPLEYAPQVWAGIEFSPSGTRGLFIDVKIRKCRIDQLNSSADYDAIHKDSSVQTNCVAWGMIGLFTTTPPADGINFFTNASEKDIELLINDITNRKIKKFSHVEISDISCDVDATLTKWEKSADLVGAPDIKHYFYGALPWKIVDIKTIDVPAYEGYLDKVAPVVKEVNDLVTAAVESQDPNYLANYMKNVNIQGVAKKAYRLNDKKTFKEHDAMVLEAMGEFPMDFK